MIAIMIRKEKKLIQKLRILAKKMILKPETPKISTKEKKCQNNDRKSMGKNLREMTTFLKSRHNHLSRNIKFSKNGNGMQKKSLPESKKGLRTLTAKKSRKMHQHLKYLHHCLCLKTMFMILKCKSGTVSQCDT